MLNLSTSIRRHLDGVPAHIQILQFLAGGAEIDTAAHIGGFLDDPAADPAGLAHGQFAAFCNIAARVGKQIPFRVAPAFIRHFFQGVFY